MPTLDTTVNEGDAAHLATHDALATFYNTWNDPTIYTPASFAPLVHNQAASTITSGILSPARLGSGTPTSSNFLRGDGTWATPVAPPTGFEGYAPTDFALVSHTHPVTDFTATGTRSATTFLRGDNVWATPAQAVVLIPRDFYIDGAAVAGVQKPKVPWRGTWTLKEVSVIANTPPTGTSMIFDLLMNGASVWTSGQRLTLPAGQTTTQRTTTFTTSAVPDGAVFQLQVVQVGATVAGSDVTVTPWFQLVSP